MSGGFGSELLAVLFVIGVVFFSSRAAGARRRRARRQPLPTLVLQEFNSFGLNENPNGILLEAVGRRPGLIAWLMDVFGISNRSYIRVTTKEVRVTESRLWGTQYFTAPLGDLRSTYCTQQKPFWRVIVAGLILLTLIFIIFVPTGDSNSSSDSYSYYDDSSSSLSDDIDDAKSEVSLFCGVSGLVLIGFLVYGYWMSTRLIIAFSTSDLLDFYGIAFKPGLVGSSHITLETALSAMRQVNEAVVDAWVIDGNK